MLIARNRMIHPGFLRIVSSPKLATIAEKLALPQSHVAVSSEHGNARKPS